MAADPCRKEIILQEVRLGAFRIQRKAGAQQRHDTLIGEILLHHIDRAAHEFKCRVHDGR